MKFTLRPFSMLFVILILISVSSTTELLGQDPLPTEKRSIFSFYLGGGMNNMNGDDLNHNIRDSNIRYAELNEMGGHIWNNIMEWEEIKCMPSFKGEIIVNLFSRFGLGLGAEYIFKTNPRISTLSKYSNRGEVAVYYEQGAFTWTTQGEHKMTVLPLTLNVYSFIPISRVAELYLTGGVGYYMAVLKYNGFERWNSSYLSDHFDSSGDLIDSYREQTSDDVTTEYEAKSNSIGFQGGLGLDFKLTSTISLIAEGNYRIVNFKNWEGNRNTTTNRIEKRFFLFGGTLIDESGTESEAFDGNLWFYEYHDRDLDNWYVSIDFFEEAPEESTRRRSIREAEINFNGFIFRIGVKVRF
jgi:opacity protein-like surface antigen